MNIVIAGGKKHADFLIGSLLNQRHQLYVINSDYEYCKYLTEKHNIPIYHGDPSKPYTLDGTEITGFDVLIALLSNDADNLMLCQYAKRIFGIKKAICTVSNPKNVDLFKKLGINVVLSATYMMAQHIAQMTSVENLVSTLSIDKANVNISEIEITEGYSCIGKQLQNISFPPNAIIGCIFRDSNMIIPNGSTEVCLHDKLLLITTKGAQAKVLAVLR